jgi:tryptophan-rich sensory protein
MIWPIVVNLIICFIIAFFSGWITRKSVKTWYRTLKKPSFNPPAWVFSPVWTVLYVIIAIVGGMLWMEKAQHPMAFIFYVLQLVLNFSWSFIFFGARQLGASVINLALLWLSVLFMLICSFAIHPIIGYLILPYFLWLTFAARINLSIWCLNSKSTPMIKFFSSL